MDDWAGIYKFARLAALAIVLAGIAVYVFNPRRKRRLEEPAQRMLEDNDQ